jgi:hypothetical protein
MLAATHGLRTQTPTEIAVQLVTTAKDGLRTGLNSNKRHEVKQPGVRKGVEAGSQEAAEAKKAKLPAGLFKKRVCLIAE